MLRPGMKMSACSHSDATLFPIQVKTKEKDISRKEAFQGLSAKKRRRASQKSWYSIRKEFSTLIFFKTSQKILWTWISCVTGIIEIKMTDEDKSTNLTLCNVGTGAVCPRYGSSCACTSCSGRRASFHKPRRQLPASRWPQSHRFWGEIWSEKNFFFFSPTSLLCF